MKIRVVANTFSPQRGERTAKIERVAYGSADATVTTDQLRVVVEVTEAGSVIVATYRLAEGGDPESNDPANWIENVSTILRPTEPRTHVSIPANIAAEVLPVESAPY